MARGTVPWQPAWHQSLLPGSESCVRPWTIKDGPSIKTDYRDSTRVSIEMSAGLSLAEILDVSTELAALGARVVGHPGPQEREAYDRYRPVAGDVVPLLVPEALLLFALLGLVH